MFVGRKYELEALNSFHNKSGFQVMVIYGRRRVGKTALCINFLKKNLGLYFLCKRDDAGLQAQSLVNKFCLQNNIYPPKVDSFEDAFLFIRDNISKKPYTLVLDEFPYLIQHNKSIPSIFQYIFDEILSNSSLHIILLGSSISIMENEVLGYKSPLYGRRTGQLKIGPLKFSDLHKLFFNQSIEDLIKIYGVVDSIPAYTKSIDLEKQFFENIKESLLCKESFLFEEVDFLLNQELREPKNYKKILLAISQGKHRLSRISDETRISVNVLTNYLDTLCKLHILKKEVPVTEKKELSRHTLYKIADWYFSFWFRFIYPNIELIEENKKEIVLEQIKKQYNSYLSSVFEDVCKKYVHVTSNYQKVGSWWYKGEEIDICAIHNTTKEILFGECKWQENVDAKELLDQLKQKTQSVNWYKNKRSEKYILFAKSFKDKHIEGVTLTDLKKLKQSLLKR